MGINNLKSLIKSCAVPKTIANYKNKKGALDTSIFLYRYIYRSPTDEECSRFVLDGFLQQLSKFKKNNIVPIYILDGVATQYKKVLEDRQRQRQKTSQRIVTFEEEIAEYSQTLLEINQKILELEDDTSSGTIGDVEVGDVGTSGNVGDVEVGDVEVGDVEVGDVVLEKTVEIDRLVPIPTVTPTTFHIHRRELHTKIEERRESVHKLNKQNRKPTSEHTKYIKQLFDVLKVPYIHSPIESDALFAYLMKRKKIDFVITEDTDMLPLGCSSFVCGFDNPKINMAEYYLYDVLNTLELDYKQFVDLCILCGCDYTDGKIEQIGPKRGLLLIKKYKTIEKIISEYIQSTEQLKEKHPYPDNFLQQIQDARNMFYTAHNFDEYINNNQEFLEKFENFEWNGIIDEDDKFCQLLDECGMDNIAQSRWLKIFSNSTSNSIETKKEKKLDPSQKTLLSFFKPVTTTSNVEKQI